MTENVSIKSLTLLDKNPRKIHKNQFDKLVKSLQEDPNFFKARPCLVNHITDSNKLVVYAGNQRVRAAKKLKWKEVPCIIDLNLDEEVMKSRTIKDNKNYGEFDYDIMGNEYDIQLLLDAGFVAEELLGNSFEEIQDTEDAQEKEKNKKLTMCPQCGHEF